MDLLMIEYISMIQFHPSSWKVPFALSKPYYNPTNYALRTPNPWTQPKEQAPDSILIKPTPNSHSRCSTVSISINSGPLTPCQECQLQSTCCPDRLAHYTHTRQLVNTVKYLSAFLTQVNHDSPPPSPDRTTPGLQFLTLCCSLVASSLLATGLISGPIDWLNFQTG